MDTTNLIKTCNKCKVEHPITYFNILNKKGDRRPDCKDCRKITNANVYKKRQLVKLFIKENNINI